MNLNNVNLVGYLADEPRLYPDAETPTKTRVWFRLGVNRGNLKDSDGKQIVDWISVAAFGKRAEAVAEFCHKGKEVTVTGELHTSSRPLTLEDGTVLVHPETQKPIYQNFSEVLARSVSFGQDSPKWKAQQAGSQAVSAAPAAAPVANDQLIADLTAAVLKRVASQSASAPDAAANPLGEMA